MSNEKISVGSIVTIYVFDLEAENKYQIVEKKTSENELSLDSVLGGILLGKTCGEHLIVKAEDTYEIEIRGVDNTNVKMAESLKSLKPAPIMQPFYRKIQGEQVMSKEKAYRGVYFCFQGKQFEHESSGGYIFAGLDPTIHHWARLKELKRGDVILHCATRYGIRGVWAISVVEEEWSEKARPLAHYLANERKDAEGLYVQCKYTHLNRPLVVSYYKKEIIELQGDHKGKGYPFNKNGQGNQGHLYKID